MKQIVLTGKIGEGRYFKISDEDYDFVISYGAWNGLKGKNEIMYVAGNDVLLHRILLERILGRKLKKGETVDHKDRDGLNNQRDNIRLATYTQNNLNTRPRNKREFKGVSPDKKYWNASIHVNNKMIHLGNYNTMEEAGIVYNHAVLKYYGEEFPYFNDIPNWRNIHPIRRKNHENIESSSGYRGVTYHKRIKKWASMIYVKKEKKHLGFYNTPEEAGIAYNHALVENSVEKWKLNDIPGWEDIHPVPERTLIFKSNTSGYRGVSYRKNRNCWRCNIMYKKKAYEFGPFETAKEAALFYNIKAKEFYGDKAVLNVIEEDS